MEEYKLQLSWTRRPIGVSPNNRLTQHLSPICSTKSGDIIGEDVYNGRDVRLVKFNVNEVEQELRVNRNDPLDVFSMVMYNESLLSPLVDG
jgi:hypothetical protein